jgi:transcriptional regulator NrdR family protein
MKCPHCHNEDKSLMEVLSHSPYNNSLRLIHCENCSKDFQFDYNTMKVINADKNTNSNSK